MSRNPAHRQGRGPKASRLLLILSVLFLVAGISYYAYTLRRISSVQDALPDKTAPEGLGTGLKDMGGISSQPLARELKAADQALKASDFRAYATHMRKAVELRPDSKDLKEALAKGLTRVAYEEYNRGNLTEAKDALKEASLLSDEAGILRNLAIVQIRLNDFAGAIQTLSPIKGADPKAGKIAATAEEAIKRGGGNGNDGKGLKEGLEIGKDALDEEALREQGMDTVQGRHFLVRFEGGENAETGHLIGLLLEEARMKVGADLGYFPDDEVEALLYSREDFHDITRTPSWAGAIYDGRIKIPAGGVTEKTEALEKVIMHEYTHAVVHRLSNGRAPNWLNEGIAQYEEGGAPEDRAVKAVVMDKKDLLRGLEGSFMGMQKGDADKAYLISLSITSYIAREFGVFSVRKILEETGKGQTVETAISNVLYMSYEDMEKGWIESLGR